MTVDKAKLEELLTRGVEDVIVRADLEKKLQSGKKLRIKLGIDPTNPQIHIGRAAALWKLRAFQDLGHQITLVIGTFTGVIGDASDKDSERPLVERKTIEENMQTYAKQIGKILDMNKVELYYNGDWFDKMPLQKFFALTQLFTIQQMTERENFAKRIEAGKPVGIHETLYPMLQGYDSVEMKTDVEIGGTDQLFNMLAGREVQKAYNMPEQNVMTLHLLEGTDGRKMSSSWGNCIYINDDPIDMYGKVMTVRDELIPVYFKLCTDVPLGQVTALEQAMAGALVEDGMMTVFGDPANPRDTKASLAHTIVARYYGDKAAQEAEEAWNAQFQKGEKPKNIATKKTKAGTVLDVVSDAFGISKSEVRRLVAQKGIKIDDKVVEDVEQKISKDCLIQVGKRRFIQLKLSK
ncbi:MAG: tyrosine--tRNA ligase [Candidatus Saccharibacteria bacterium]